MLEPYKGEIISFADYLRCEDCFSCQQMSRCGPMGHSDAT